MYNNSHLAPGAVARRENSRGSDGKFGIQMRREADSGQAGLTMRATEQAAPPSVAIYNILCSSDEDGRRGIEALAHFTPGKMEVSDDGSLTLDLIVEDGDFGRKVSVLRINPQGDIHLHGDEAVDRNLREVSRSLREELITRRDEVIYRLATSSDSTDEVRQWADDCHSSRVDEAEMRHRDGVFDARERLDQATEQASKQTWRVTEARADYVRKYAAVDKGVTGLFTDHGLSHRQASRVAGDYSKNTDGYRLSPARYQGMRGISRTSKVSQRAAELINTSPFLKDALSAARRSAKRLDVRERRAKRAAEMARESRTHLATLSQDMRQRTHVGW